jgi:cobalt/nickel transport system permease protein
MHVPDGYLGPETLAAGWAACLPAWYVANRRTKELLSEPKVVPVLAASAAFSFLVMMLNVPVFGGTTAHAVGAVLVAVIAGPWVAVLAVTAALVIQALLFADGGILALGVNCFNMAVAMPLTGYLVYVLVAGDSDLRSTRRLLAAGLGAYAGLIVAGALVALELGIQPALHTVDGLAVYSPYGLKTTFVAMLGSHLLIVGPVEALFTTAVFAFLRTTSPGVFRAGDSRRVSTRWLAVAAIALIAAVPLGLIAAGTAWGEWGAAELRDRVGYVPEGLSRFEGLWRGVLPGYAVRGAGGAVVVVAYVAAALLGVAILALATWLLVRARRLRRRDTAQVIPFGARGGGKKAARRA